MATVRERNPGVWEARVYIKPRDGELAGRQVTKTFRGSKRVTAKLIGEWERELQGSAAAAGVMTVGRALVLWQEAKVAQWQPTTVREHKHRSASVTRDLGSVRLNDLDPMQVDAWVARLRRDGVGEGAIRGRVATLRAAMTWAVSRRLIRSNPVAEADPDLRTKGRAPTVDSDAVGAVLRASSKQGRRAELGLYLAIATGAREAELVALAWDDLEGIRLRIGRQHHSLGGSLVRDRTKTGSARTVVLDEATVRMIKDWKEEVRTLVGGDAGRWMLAQPGSALPPSPRWLYDVFCRAAKEAKVPHGRAAGFVFHDLRHWVGSVALRDGHDPVTVAARLGHSPDTLLRIYAQEVADGQTEVANSIAARMATMVGERK